MIIIKTVAAFRNHVAKLDTYPVSSGFVPTMGALHRGHISLIEKCREENRFTVACIFVNPTQFNNPIDFQKYPITIGVDIQMLEEAGCNILFLPSVAEMYPQGTEILPNYPLDKLGSSLEGHYRPGHFQGVCQVVHRLLNIVEPANLYLGQKDFQQCLIIKKMIANIGLQVNVRLVSTIREAGGLAMSSRNMRLSEEEKMVARSIYRQLQMIKAKKGLEPPFDLKQIAVDNLLKDGFSKVDYVEIINAWSLEPLTGWENGGEAVALIAAYIGEVRLIDNMILN